MRTTLPYAALVAAWVIAASSAPAQQRIIRPLPAMPNVVAPVPLPPQLLPPQAPALTLAPLPIPAPVPMQVAPVRLPQAEGPEVPELIALYQKIADLYGAAKYQEAVPLAEDYVAGVGNVVGIDGLAYASAISLLSRVHQAQGRFAEAEPLLKRSISLIEREPGHESELATELDARAQLYDSQGRFEEAERDFARALTLNEKNPRNFGGSLNDLAWVYQEEGRYAEAEPLAKQAIDVIGKTLGTNSPDYGCALDTLAKLYEGQGRVAEAEPLYRQALANLETTLGPENVSVATSRENLGGLLKALGKLDEAERLLKQALATKERIYGKNHLNVAKTLSQLGDLYRAQGKPGEADPLFQRALSIQKDALVEVPVFFATDRAPEQSGKGIHFGSGRSETLTFGQATVVVPKPQAGARLLRIPVQSDPDLAAREPTSQTAAPAITATEATHLPIRNMTVAPDNDRLLNAAALRLGTAANPGEALIFVHGYNVSFENGLRRAAQIAYDIKFDGAMFLFSWPSRERIEDYLLDTDTVTIAADHLGDLVKTIVSKTKVRKIHFVAHSMGNMVLLRALTQIAADPALSPVIGEIIDAAPDIDSEVFVHTVKAIKDSGGNFTLYASHGDWALWLSGWLHGLARAGFIGDKALITPGVETIDITSAGASYFSLNHDVYASSPVLVADMQRIIAKREHPPDKRTREFEPVASKDGTYWLFRRQIAAAQPETGSAFAPAPSVAPPIAVPTAIPGPESASKTPASPPVNPNTAMAPPDAPAEPPVQASPPASTATLPPGASGTAAPAAPPVKTVQRKKRLKRDVDPDWNTKLLH